MVNREATSIFLIADSDEDLWARFKSGNVDSFSLLYKKHYRALYNYGINLGLDSSLASDAIQELFLKLYSRPELITDTSTIRPFLFRSVKNYFLNLLKKEETNVELSKANFSFEYTIDESIIAEEESQLLKQRVEKILSQLTDRQKEIVYFRFLHEMEYEEIAQIMNISEQGARNLLSKTFKKIRENDSDFLMLLLLLKINHL